jgi:hypothetical protein
MLGLLLALALRSHVAATSAPPSPPLFKLLPQVDLPPELHAAIDLRWASADSVYLALGRRRGRRGAPDPKRLEGPRWVRKAEPHEPG